MPWYFFQSPIGSTSSSTNGHVAMIPKVCRVHADISFPFNLGLHDDRPGLALGAADAAFALADPDRTAEG
ncbi:hypothetical protein CCP4SC76_3260016 [Gammaproteobacteria bacterium]